MSKVIYHKFMGRVPILCIESLDNFANGILSDGEYCKTVKITGSPLKFIVLESDGIREKLGNVGNSTVDSMLAVYAGTIKYPHPDNFKLALGHAIQLTVKESTIGAYSILSKMYETTYDCECPWELDEYDATYAWQVDDQGDTTKKKNWGKRIEDMDDELDDPYEELDDEDLVEAILSELVTDAGNKESQLTGTNKPETPAQKKKTQKAKQKRAVSGNDPKRGYTHVKGGDGNLYVKGDISAQQAQKKGASHKFDGKKMVVLNARDKAAMAAGKESGQVSGQNGQQPQTGAEPRVVKVVDKDGSEIKKSRKEKVGKETSDTLAKTRKTTAKTTKAKFMGKTGDNSNMKPDAIIKRAKGTVAYNPLDNMKITKKTDNFTKAVSVQLSQGRTLIAHTDEEGNPMRCDNHEGQVHYMRKNIEGLIDLVQDPSNFENKGTYNGVVSFTEDFANILNDLPDVPTPEDLATGGEKMMEAYRMCLQLSNEDEFSSSLLKNFGEFVEHNYELMRGEENYMPGVGNFEVGDKVKIHRDGKGEIVRMEHGSFKTEKKGVQGKVKFAGAAPSISGELAAVTFFSDDKKDAAAKEELENLFRDKDKLGDKAYNKALVSAMKTYFGDNAVKEYKKTLKEVMANDENKFKSKLEMIDKYANKYPKAAENLKPFREKLVKHIANYAATEAIFNRRETADFSTQIMAFNLSNNTLVRGERTDVKSYKRHSKFSAVKLDSKGATKEDMMDISKLRKFFDIQGANAKPIYDVAVKTYSGGE